MITLLTLFCVALLIAGPASAYFLVLSPLLGIGVTAFALLILSILFFVSVSDFVRFGARETNWFAFLAGFASLAGLIYLGYLANDNPLHDVTTNTQAPLKFAHPAFPFTVAKGGEYLDPSLQINREYDAYDAAIQAQLYPDFAPIVAKAPPAEVYLIAIKTVQSQMPDWHAVLDDPKTMRAEWEIETPIFRFVDDVALEVHAVPHHPFDATVEFRSRSRVGTSDLGKNVKHFRDLKVRLELAVQRLEQQFLQDRTAFESGAGPAPVPPLAPTPVPVPAPVPVPVPVNPMQPPQPMTPPMEMKK